MKKLAIVAAAILVVLLILALYLHFRRPVVSYSNTTPNFYYLATEDHLYLLAAIQKLEHQDPGWFVSPQFGFSYPNQLLYLFDITADGQCRAYSFVPPKVMSGVITVVGINLVRCDDGLVLFDGSVKYRFDGKRFGEVPPETAAALSELIRERGTSLSRKPLDEWNKAHGVIGSGELAINVFGEHWQLDWKRHHLEFTCDSAPGEDVYRITVSAPTLWRSALRMTVPWDRLPEAPHPDREPGFGPVRLEIPISNTGAD